MTDATSDTVEPLPVSSPAMLPRRDEAGRWLVEDLWPAAAVGIVGGSAKSMKTHWAVELAVSVASRTRCLDTHDVHNAGRVLIYAAEDSLADLRARLEGVCQHRGLDLESLDVGVITVDRLRLDHRGDSARLDATVAQHRPTLLVLDPFVRLCSGVDENSANEVSAVLGDLRALQRRHQTAVLLVHHARKNPGRLRPGLALRGSSDFFAWTDVTHFLVRKGERVRVLVEHRSARSPEPFQLELVDDPGSGEGLHLQRVLSPTEHADNAQPTSAAAELRAHILAALSEAAVPLSQTRLRRLVRGRNEVIAETLRQLEREGLVGSTPRGWTAASSPTPKQLAPAQPGVLPL